MIWRSRSLSARSAKSIALSRPGSSGSVSAGVVTRRSESRFATSCERQECPRLSSQPPARGSAWPRARAASRALRARSYRNIPTGEAHGPYPAEVTVHDPRHPLYGRCFRVLRRLTGRGGNFLPSFEVEHPGGTSLLIPEAATEPRQAMETGVKLCVEGLRDLVSLAEPLDEHADRPGRFVGDAPGSVAAAHRRRRRRGPGGEAS
jgi:hypothetical protein